jgi:membrane-bound lytic murein transglycosylase A
MVVTSISSASRGKRKARKRRLVPFNDRAAIDDGVLSGRELEICWLKDPIDALFAHIQGSVRVRLDDGESALELSAANGHPYGGRQF